MARYHREPLAHQALSQEQPLVVRGQHGPPSRPRRRDIRAASTQTVVSRDPPILRQEMCGGSLTSRNHKFFFSKLTYREMPAELRADLSDARLTILEGDLN
ncbi:ARMT1-like domain-containing protein, partial [Streptomyces sp. BE20]|nr:ARMT1-like domain-containing protein [Streptomyces sp. BE20]